MTALYIHLNELLAVLRASAGLDPSAGPPAQLREAVEDRLRATDPLLAERVRRLDEWHTDALAQLVADAHALAQALEASSGEGEPDTRVE